MSETLGKKNSKNNKIDCEEKKKRKEQKKTNKKKKTKGKKRNVNNYDVIREWQDVVNKKQKK